MALLKIWQCYDTLLVIYEQIHNRRNRPDNAFYNVWQKKTLQFLSLTELYIQ